MGAKQKIHKFCKTCGSSILIDFRKIELGITDNPEEDTLAINVKFPTIPLPSSLLDQV